MDLQQIVSQSSSFSGVLKNFGLKNIGGNYKTLRNRLHHEKIDWSHIKMGRGSNKGRSFFKESTPIEEILVENSTFCRTHLKERLIKENVIPHDKCAKCGMGREWLGEPLVLVLDHINGVRDDNRKENLRFLCPNCNSQTDNFSGKNSKIYCPMV